jgi:hypothetical protein
LVFAGVFANQEGQIRGFEQVKLRFENSAEVVEGDDWLFLVQVTAEPVGGRSVFLKPRARSGDNYLSPGCYQFRKGLEAAERRAEPVDQIREQHHVEPAKGGSWCLGVTRFEGDPATVDVDGHRGGAGCADLAFLGESEGERTVKLELAGDLDESEGMVDSDDFGTMSGQFEGGTADGAAEIQRAGLGREARYVEAFGDTAHRVIEGASRSERPWENLVRAAVMEQEVFGQCALGFVVIGGFLSCNAL